MAGSKLQRRRGPGARVRFNDLFKLPRIPALIGCRHASAVSCARQGLAGLPDHRGGAGAGEVEGSCGVGLRPEGKGVKRPKRCVWGGRGGEERWR